MALDSDDFAMFKAGVKALQKRNELLEEQNQILVQILEQMRYLR
jgi:hypothetical protein